MFGRGGEIGGWSWFRVKLIILNSSDIENFISFRVRLNHWVGTLLEMFLLVVRFWFKSNFSQKTANEISNAKTIVRSHFREMD